MHLIGTEYLYKDDKENFLCFVFEKITSANVNRWRTFATQQNTHVPNLKFRKTVSGVIYFSKVLYTDALVRHNEIWVAYVIPNSCSRKDMSQIKLFLLMITTKKALVSTHMGISRTIEEAQRLEMHGHQPVKFMSVMLHSFAAECTHAVYPEKKYMVTIPNKYMREIFIKCLDKSMLHVGDNLFVNYVERLKQAAVTATKTDVSVQPENLLNTSNVSDDYIAFHSVLQTHPPVMWKDDLGMIINNELTIRKDDTAYNWLFYNMFTPEGDHPSGYAPYVVIPIQGLIKHIIHG